MGKVCHKRARLLCEMFLAQKEDGHITPVKARQFLLELKDYIEESNEEVTLGRVLS